MKWMSTPVLDGTSLTLVYWFTTEESRGSFLGPDVPTPVLRHGARPGSFVLSPTGTSQRRVPQDGIRAQTWTRLWFRRVFVHPSARLGVTKGSESLYSTNGDPWSGTQAWVSGDLGGVTHSYMVAGTVPPPTSTREIGSGGVVGQEASPTSLK